MATAAVPRRQPTSRNGMRTSMMGTPTTPTIDSTPTPVMQPEPLTPKLSLPPSMPMAHMGFEGSRHLEPERLPSGRKERARTVRVIELNQDTIESIKQIADGIRRLDLSSLKLEELNEGLFETLVGLERLDVGFNCLTDEGIPPCFSKLENLIEFAAHYNKLSTVPKTLKKLKNITRLKIGHNNIKSMEGIERLKKLQVLVIENNEIEAVPREVYQNLKRLEMWHFSNNLLKEVHSDIRLLRYLRDLDVSGNNLATLPPELFLLPRLEVLNASGNQITRIPTVNIKGNNRQHLSQVDLSDNQLIKFPEHLLLIAEKVDLSKNRIKVIPSNLIKKLDWGTEQQLNVDDNPLSNPPLEVCECGLRSIMQYFQEAKTDQKVYQGLKVLVLGAPGSGKTSLVQTLVDQQSRLTTAEEVTSGIDMYDLSLEVEPEVPEVTETPPEEPPPPPSPIVKEPVKKQLKKRSRSTVKRKDRASVDSEESSRTSSRTTRKGSPEKKVVVEEPPAVTLEPPDDAAEPPKEPAVPEKRALNLAVWDFSGNAQYLFSSYIFLQQPSLVWLVFDLSTYDDAQFSATLGCWIDWIIAKTNHFVAIIIGTQADKLRPKKVEAICENVGEKIKQHLQNHKDMIEREIKKIESKPHISPALSEQLKRYISLKKIQPKIFPQVIPVSAKDTAEMEVLLEATKTMAMDKDVYPEVLKVIPSLWANVEYYIEDKGYGLQYHSLPDDVSSLSKEAEQKLKVVPILTYDEYSEEVSKKFGMKHLIDQITRYLHDTGKIMWFSEHPTLCDYVFLRPSWLADLLKSLFRHDWTEADYTLEEAFKASNLNPHKIEKLKKELTEEGIADKDILKCLWSHLVPTELNKPILEVIGILLDHFELGYPMARAGARDTGRAVNSDRSDSTSTLKSSKPSMQDRGDSLTRSERPASQATSLAASKKNEKPDPPKVSRMLIPWLRTTKQPKAFSEEYEQFTNNPCLIAVFRFPKYTPPGLFETLIVRALRPSHDLSSLHHWTDGLYAKNVSQALRFHLQRIPHDDGSTCVRVEVRSESQTLKMTSQEDADDVATQEDQDDKMAENLWGLLLPYLKDVEELVGKFAGARVERYMECPECKAMSFLGEWNTPKELQNSARKPCDACKLDIPTRLLIQPKEKKKVEEFLLLKLQKQAAARAEAAAAAAQQPGDSGIETGSNVIPITESRDQADVEQNGVAAENPAERKKRASVESRTSESIRQKSGTKEKKDRRTSERSIKSNDDVFEDEAKKPGTVGATKSAILKKRKRSTVSQPDSH